MLALLTLSLASAEQVEDHPVLLAADQTGQDDARSALIEAASTCCIVASAPVLMNSPSMVSGRNVLRFSRGHTRRGMLDYFGGMPVSEQVMLYDDFPVMISTLQSPVYQRVGTTMHRPNTGLPPIRHPGAY